MSKLLTIVLVLCGSVFAANEPGWNSGPQGATGSTAVANVNSSVIIGPHHIVLVSTYHPNTSTETVSETVYSLSGTLWKSITSGTTVVELWCFYTASNGGPNSTPANFRNAVSPNATFINIAAVEKEDGTYTSCAAALDSGGTGAGVGSNSGTGTSLSCCSGTVSSTVTGDTVVAVCDSNTNANTISVGSGFFAADNAGNSQTALIWEFKQAGAAGSQTSTCTDTTSGNWVMVQALILPATNSGTSGVFYRGQQTGLQTQSNGTTVALNYPTWIVSGDALICHLAGEFPPAYATNAYQVPAGWTAIINNGQFAAMGKLWTTGTSQTFTANQSTGFQSGVCGAYGGVNQSTPFDNGSKGTDFILYAPAGFPTLFSPDYCKAPAISPSWTTDFQVLVFAELTNGTLPGITVPGNFMARFPEGRDNSGNGTPVGFYDSGQPLTSAAATSNVRSTYSGAAGNTNQHQCGQYLIMPAGGGSSATRVTQPIQGAVVEANSSLTTTDTFPYVGDLVIVKGAGVSNTCSVTGFTTYLNANSIYIGYRVWTNSDTPGALSTSGCSGSNLTWQVVVERNAFNPATSPQIFSGNTATNSGTTVASPNIATISTLNSSSLLELFFVATSLNGTFTPPGTPVNDAQYTQNSATMLLGMSLQGPANPSTSFTVTNSLTGTQDAAAVDVCITGFCTNTTGGFPVVY